MPIDLTKLPPEEVKESPQHKLYRLYTDPVSKSLGVGNAEDMLKAMEDTKDSKLMAQLKGFAAGAGGAVSPEHLGTVLSMIPTGGASILPRLRNALGLIGNTAMTTHGALSTTYDAFDKDKSKTDVALDVLNTGMGALGAGTNIRGLKLANQAITAANAANAAKPGGLRVALDTVKNGPTSGPTPKDVIKSHEALANHLAKNTGDDIAKEIYGEAGAPSPKKPSIVDYEIAHDTGKALRGKELREVEKAHTTAQKLDNAEAAADTQINASGLKDQADATKQLDKDLYTASKASADSDKGLGKAQETTRKAQEKTVKQEEKATTQANKQATGEEIRDQKNLADVMKWRQAEDAKKAQQALVDQALAEGNLQPQPPTVTTTAKGVGPEGEAQTLRQTHVEPPPEAEGEGGEGGDQGVSPNQPKSPFQPEEFFDRNKAIRRADQLGGPGVARIIKQSNGTFRVQHVMDTTPGAVKVTPEMAQDLKLGGEAEVGKAPAGPPENPSAPEGPPEPPAAPTPKPKGKGPRGGPKPATEAAKAVPEVPTATPEVPKAEAPVQRYQWQRNAQGGQEFGNQEELHPITEAVYDKYLKPLGRDKGLSFDAWKAKYAPKSTHISLITQPGEAPRMTGVVDVNDPVSMANRNKWAKPVESFDSPEAKEWGASADQPEVTEPPKADLTTTAPTPTAVVPAKGKTPKPAKAVAAVKNQLEKVIDVSGEKNAKAMKDKILAGLAQELPAAEENSNVLNTEHSLKKPANRGRELSDAAIASQKANGNTGAGQLVVRIPGDGTFKVDRNPVAIREFMRRIERESSTIWSDLKAPKAPGAPPATEGGLKGATPKAAAKNAAAKAAAPEPVPETPPVAAPEAPQATNVPEGGAAPIRIFKSPLQAAGQNLTDINAAKKAGEVIPEEGRAVSGRAAQRLNTEAADAVASGAKSPQDFSHLPEVGQNALFRSLGKRIKGEKGEIDPMFGIHATGALAGGLTGYATDPLDDPTLSTVAGAGLGAAAPSLATALPRVAPRIAPVVEKGLDWANKIHNTGLLSPLSVVKKAAGDIGGLTTAGLMNPSKAGGILRQFTTPEGIADLTKNFRAGFNGPDQEALSGLENFIQKGPMSLAGRTMGGLTGATKGVLGNAGFTPEEQAYYTLTAKPQTAFGKGAKVFLDTKPMQHISPFARIGINRLERGVEFSPLGLIRNPKAYATAEGAKDILAKSALGTAAGIGAYEATPDNFVRDHPTEASLIAAMGGPLGIPLVAGMAMKQTHRGDQPSGTRATLQSFDDASKAVAQDVPGLRLFEDLSAKSKEAFLRNYLSGYTNFARPAAIAMDPYTKWDGVLPQPEDPDTSSKGLDLFSSLFNRTLSNIPIERSTLPRRDGSTPLSLEQALSQTTGQ